jgi:hypothetical protein
LNACIPDLKKKAKLWDLLVYKDEDLFNDEYEAIMQGFARKSQYSLLKQYFKDRFFDDFIYVKNNHSKDYATLFFKNLAPRFVLNENIKNKFTQLQRVIASDEYELFHLVSNSKIV